MKIAGLQKLSLIDYPGKLACTVFLFGCNFKCGFCHNPELVVRDKPEQVYSEKEVLNFLEERKKYLDGVCITGGEPLINPDIAELIKKIKKLGYLVKIDTNGSNPELLKELIERELADYVALDIKTDKNNYNALVGKEADINKIEESIKLILESEIEHEFRTTVIRGYHNSEIMKKIGSWLNKMMGKKPTKFYIQNFVPREGKLVDKKFGKIKQFDDKELEELKRAVSEYFESVEIRS